MSEPTLTCEFLPRRVSLFSFKKVSAVFLIAFTPEGKVVSCRNERGWDIPGGHLEGNETVLQALMREVGEETGISFSRVSLFAQLTPRASSKKMLVFTTNKITVGKFSPSEDALERAFFLPADLVGKYHGNRQLLQSLIDEAVNRLKEDA